MKTALLSFAFFCFSCLSLSAQNQKPLPGQGAGYEEPFHCQGTISSTAFNREISKIRMQSSNTTKRMLARQLATRSCLTAAQVYKLCLALPLNNDRLSFAKKCYMNCPDQENYEVVFRAMRTEWMLQQLKNYIGWEADGEHHDCGDHHDHHDQPDQPINGCRRPMNATEFAAAKQTIEDASFDETKVETAKTITTTNCLTTDQVMELCKLLSFDESKLNFAKFAYRKVWDRSNYFKVASVLSFDASKSELNKFIQSGGN